MWIGVITIFPQLFDIFLRTALVGKAIKKGLMRVEVYDLRKFADDKHKTVDDYPYGGGAGMVMKAPPWIKAVRSVSEGKNVHRVLLSPQGKVLDDCLVQQLAKKEALLLMCGRYEGIDERVSMLVVDEEISIGNYVLSGGELPAMVVIEAVSRYIPGVVKRVESVKNDSFSKGILDYPHYTRPRVVEGISVPPVLLSGDHAAIEQWRKKKAIENTLQKRPDLLTKEEENGSINKRS